MTPAPTYSPGLEGVIAGETAISSVEDGLRYRGYPVTELAEQCTFDEVAYLLLCGDLPTKTQLDQFLTRVSAARRLTQPIRDLLMALPKWTLPLDALRTSVSALAHFDQDMTDNSHEANVRKAERLLAQLPVAICDLYHYTHGRQPVEQVAVDGRMPVGVDGLDRGCARPHVHGGLLLDLAPLMAAMVHPVGDLRQRK